MKIPLFAPLTFVLAVLMQLMATAVFGADVLVAERCGALSNQDAELQSALQIAVRSANLMPAAGPRPAHCKLEGAISEQTDIEVQLPVSNWNGNLLALANTQTGEVCDQYLRRGYACMPVYRNLKKDRSDEEWATARMDPQVRLEANVAPHLLTMAAKQVIQRYYAKPVKKSYLMGCSSGGYTAMLEAQRFPWDYDGIAAGAPNLDTADWLVRALWHTRNWRAENGEPFLSSSDLQLLHRSTLAACDRDDGVADSIVSNPLGCHVDLSRLACHQSKRGDCLSSAQIAAIERLYAGPALSVPELAGSKPNMLAASESTWFDLGSSVWLSRAMPAYIELMFDGARPKVTAQNFDFKRDYKQTSLARWMAVDNPDLRRFKKAGAKMIAYLGGNDVAYVNGIIDYYETVERTMGSRAATQEFFRFFLVPGMHHCTGGEGAYAVDYLSYLEAWVEHGKAPDVLIGAHPANPTKKELEFPLDSSVPVAFTRPIYPYPAYPRYKGTGDLNDASSFVAIDPSVTTLGRD